MYGKSSFLEGQSVFKFRRPFDYPNSEDFTNIEKVILVTVHLVKFSEFIGIAYSAGYYPVNESGAEYVFGVHPVFEACLKSPKINVLVDAGKKLFAVVVDEFTAEDYETIEASLPAFPENTCKFCGERIWRCLVKFAAFLVDYAGFCSVADDDGEVRGFSEVEDFLPAVCRVRVDSA